VGDRSPRHVLRRGRPLRPGDAAGGACLQRNGTTARCRPGQASSGDGAHQVQPAGSQLATAPQAARVVLVVGQVEGDASIRLGTVDLRTNRQLLAAVRAAEPEAWLLYKPHPDVVAGLRRGNPAEIDAAGLCDELVVEAAMEPLYAAVEAVHVLTSLAGFEALLRGKEVHTWGLPFNEGWCLTHDRLSCPRRNRRLTLDELVHASLIAYPRYVSRRSGLFVEAEEAIEELVEWRRSPEERLRSWQRIFRRAASHGVNAPDSAPWYAHRWLNPWPP
jgi:capsule polysaccharide export protein KpsC/LpsZ